MKVDARRMLWGLALLLPASGGLSAATPDALSYASLRDLGAGERRVIADVDLGHGRRSDLLVSRFEILAPDAAVLVNDRTLATDVVLLRGRALDDPASQLFLGVSRHGAHGFVRGDHPDIALSTGPWSAGDARELHATRTVELPVPAAAGGACLTDESFVVTPAVPGGVGPAGATGPYPCRALRLAIDTDYEFTANLFGGDPEAAAAYAITLFAADSEIYRDQLNTRFVISYLRVWASDEDPYAGTDIGTTLGDFRAHWNGSQSGVPRDLAHVLSGGSGGGVAWVGVVCHPTYGYGASRVDGFFPVPVQSNQPGNWDLVVTCHELGHNFGTGHTHGYEPPIDNCAGGECEDAANGTLMSYCHLCPGGIANMALAFHPIVRDTILGYLDGACDLTTSDVPVALDDAAIIAMNGAVEIDVLLNDLAGTCEDDGSVVIASYDPISVAGGAVELLPEAGPTGRDLLAYAAPSDFTGIDSFTYEHPSGAMATVTIDVLALRPADDPGNLAGAAVDYFALSPSPSSLPDFDTLTPVSSDVVEQIDFPSTDGDFATSGMSDNVGAVFTGSVTVPSDGLYTLFTNSDDGSRLYVGADLVVDNDGLHGMVEIGGLVALEAGAHDVRVEFFEAGGGAGLIVSFMGPGVGKQTIPADSWSHDGCTGDLDGDGAVTIDDLLTVLGSWGPCGVPCAGDVDGNGEVDIDDLLAVIAAFGPCP